MEHTALLTDPAKARPDTGYVQRHGRPRRKGSRTTSVLLSPEERVLLERLAGAADTTLNDIWRRALRLYARENGLLDEPASEVRTAV